MFAPGKLFQHSLMFAGKAGAYPSEEPFRYSTLGKAPILIKNDSSSFCRGVSVEERDLFNNVVKIIKLFLSSLVTRQNKLESIYPWQALSTLSNI